MSGLCEVCGERKALYVCSSCGRAVCQECFHRDLWLCDPCYKVRASSYGEASIGLNTLLLPVGLMLTLIGIVLMMLSFVEGEGLFIIFPFGVIYGGRGFEPLPILLILLMILIPILLFFILGRLRYT
mgnify:CR=1 FL=1